MSCERKMELSFSSNPQLNKNEDQMRRGKQTGSSNHVQGRSWIGNVRSYEKYFVIGLVFSMLKTKVL